MSIECDLEFPELDELDGINWDDADVQAFDSENSKFHLITPQIQDKHSRTCNSNNQQPSNSYKQKKIEYIAGFCEENGKTWQYPINLPLREYQFSIVKRCLFQNTLVCLPTGLGKTFIAAVVMLNFYRWYPQGKIVFLAPTKPLVNQQVNACCSITALSQSDVTELTGATSAPKRSLLWRENRVFFLTPQVLQNDLSSGICPAGEIVCCVIDEAHKALGNYAYTHVVRELVVNSVKFRVLALSATPGDDLGAIQEVINNLLISCIELRTEESIDVLPYTHQRKVEKYVVRLDGIIGEINVKFLSVLTGVVRKLYSHKAVYTEDAKKLSKFQLIKARENFRSSVSGAFVGAVESEFAVGISLYNSYEQLYASGIRACHLSINRLLDEGKSSARLHSEVARNVELNQLIAKMQKLVDSMYKFFIRTSSLDPNISIVSLTDTSIDLTSSLACDDFFYSHPKLLKLEEIVVSHFRHSHTMDNIETRVMIFSTYRDSVEEISVMLHRHLPLVRVMCFYGHGNKLSGAKVKGFSQKEQIKVVERFRDGGYNVLVSTCVGEEGLDIGDVDLIVCFDSPKAPTRYVQRMGRTGRKREGRIVMLLSEGKEEQAYQKCQTSKKHIYKIITEGRKHLNFYTNSPRMVPSHLTPQPDKVCLRQEETEIPVKLSKVKKGSRIKSAKNLPGFSSAASTLSRDQGYLSRDEMSELTQKYRMSDEDILILQQRLSPYTGKREMLSIKPEGDSQDTTSTTKIKSLLPDCSEWLDCQCNIQTGSISHSTTSNSLISCLRIFDSLKNSDKAALRTHATSDREQSIHSGIRQLTLKTNINRVVGKSPKNKKKHTRIDELENDSAPECPMTENDNIEINDIPMNTVVTKHPFASARVKQQIFTLESSSDQFISDDNQPNPSPRNYSSSPLTPIQNSSSQELLKPPNFSLKRPLVLQSSQDSLNSTEEYFVPDYLIHGSKHPTIIDEESVEICISPSHAKNKQTDSTETFESKDSSISNDPLMQGNTNNLLSKTSTPRLGNSDVICIDQNYLDATDKISLKSVSISPLIHKPITSSFSGNIPGSSNRKKKGIARTVHKNIESSDSENEALKSLFRKRKFQSKRQIISSQFSPPLVPQHNNPRKKRKLNYFIDDEAIESDGEYSQEPFQSPTCTNNRSLPDSSYNTDYSAVSRLIADTSASTTGCNESSMYARYVRDIISPPCALSRRLVIDPKRHRTLAAAGKNILKFKERDFDSNLTDLSANLEAEEVYGIVDEDSERIFLESLVSNKTNNFVTPPKQTATTDSVILIEDSVELSKPLIQCENVSFSLGMGDWLDDSSPLELEEGQDNVIVENNNSSKLMDSAQKQTFSLGMEDWWDNIDPGDLDTDFLTNNQPNDPSNIPSNPSIIETTTTTTIPTSTIATTTTATTGIKTTTATTLTSTPLVAISTKECVPVSPLPIYQLPSVPSPICLNENSKAIKIESFSSTFKSPYYSSLNNQSFVMTSSPNDNDLPIIIFADTREVSSSHILSSLRIKHEITVQVFSLKQCSFLVSSRMAVDRQNISDLSQQNSSQRIIDRGRYMCDLYERSTIIIEKDRVKGKLQDNKNTGACVRNQMCLTNLARLCKSRLSVVFSGSEQNTVDILVSLSKQEAKRGHKITGSLSRIDTPLFKFISCIPKISPTIALGLATHLKNISQLSSVTPIELKRYCHGITKDQIDSMLNFLAHQFKSYALIE